MVSQVSEGLIVSSQSDVLWMFDGQDDYVNVDETYPQLDSLSEQYTISCWIKRGVNSNGKLMLISIRMGHKCSSTRTWIKQVNDVFGSLYGDGSISGECASK